ncbi:MAG: hypothetical protein K2O91_10155 [Lachnospiraceae bacterium]|nr:hypothetical protein [Lachnospiraceae bacterium]
MDIRLAALNEYVEFLEEDLNDPEGGIYYKRAGELAEIIMKEWTDSRDSN